MKSTTVDSDGTVRCPVCRSTQFALKRTVKAKVLGVATVGIGVLAMPKRAHCMGCGADLRMAAQPDAAAAQTSLAELEAAVQHDEDTPIKFPAWRRARDAEDLAAGRKPMGMMAASTAHAVASSERTKRKQALKAARKAAR
jgi:hypothetical protein